MASFIDWLRGRGQPKDDFLRASAKLASLWDPKRKRCATDLARAEKILGADRVVTLKEAGDLWRPKYSPLDVPDFFVPYSEKEMSFCAAENKKGRADWHLVFMTGMSFEEMERKRSTCSIPALSVQDPEWRSEPWWKKKTAPGYLLVNMRMEFLGKPREESDAMLARAGMPFVRMEEPAVAECVLSFSFIRGKKFLERETHWGTIAVTDPTHEALSMMRARFGDSLRVPVSPNTVAHLRVGYFGKTGVSVFASDPVAQEDSEEFDLEKWDGAPEGAGIMLSIPRGK